MNSEKFFLAMNEIDIKFIEEADNVKGHKNNTSRRTLKFLLVAAIIVGILVCSFAVYARISLNDWTPSIRFFDKEGNSTDISVNDKAFFKDLPDDLPLMKETENMLAMTESQVEGILGFQILDSTLTDKIIQYNYKSFYNKTNDKVAVIKLWCPFFIEDSDEKKISAMISILSTHAEEGYIQPFIEGTDAMGGKIFVEKCFLANLGVDCVVYTHDDIPLNFKATFVYDNVYYEFEALGYTEEEFINVLLNLEGHCSLPTKAFE